jgi:hypothetical protein
MEANNQELDTLFQIKDFWWTFVLPAICLFGFLTNLVNIVVFVQLKSKNPIYKLMLTNSVSNFIYSFICFFVFMMRCGRYCSIQNMYWVKFYEKYMFFYFTSCLGLFNVFIELLVSIQRYYIVTKPELKQKFSWRYAVIILFLFSLAIYTPNIAYRQIVHLDSFSNATSLNSTFNFYLIQNDNSNQIAKQMIMFVSGLRGVLVLILLFVVNLLLLHRFRYQVDKKAHIKSIISKENSNFEDIHHQQHEDESRLKREATTSQTFKRKTNENEQRAKKNMTRMVIWMSIFFLIGNLLNTVSFYVLEIAQNSVKFITWFVLISNSLLFTSHGINIIFYYFFNNNYRNIFKKNFLNCKYK